jgi:uncharacterized protein YndB with AHSA1/START domain
VPRPPEEVFEYLTNPSNLRDWPTPKTSVEALTEDPLRGAMRFAEPIARRIIARQFAQYQENLRRNIEAQATNSG